MRLLRRKRIYALILLGFLVMLFVYTDWLSRWMYPVKFEQDILISAEQHGVDPLLIASIIRVESNYRPDLVSSKNAIGLMQLMPDTALWIVEQANYTDVTADRLFQEDVNIHLGAWYLQYLSKLFRTDTPASPKDEMAVVIAAYNAGPGNVQRWLREGVWDGTAADAKSIPFGETRHYLQRVNYYYEKYASIYADDWR